MEYRAIIADDEPELRTHLKSVLLEAWPGLVICGEGSNGREALDLALSRRPDIAFLDIRMPGMSGMEVAGMIARQCLVVFVTAFDGYAVEAFEREAVDYLLKPVTKERMARTVDRLKKRMDDPSGPSPRVAEVAEYVIRRFQAGNGGGYLQWIRAQNRDTVRLIPVEEVDYFKAEDKYTLVITGDGESLIRKSIRDLAHELDPSRFWQIHRAVIVNVSKIDGVSKSLTGRGVMKLKDRPELLTVARGYLHLFRQT